MPIVEPPLRDAMKEAIRRGIILPGDSVPDSVKRKWPHLFREDKAHKAERIGPTPCAEPDPPYSLHEFMKHAWHVVEPATPRLDNWHIHAICDHLTACTLGREIVIGANADEGEPGQVVKCGVIRKLIINIPPRCEKSLLVSVFWPCWVWTFRPSARWIFASYAETLAVRDSVKCRNILQSPWYRKEFGHVFKLKGDQNVKSRYENTSTGYRIATSVDGIGTGDGGDFVAVDDPNNVRESESELVREGTNEWWNETMSSRYNNPETSCHLIVQQRTHTSDLTGDQLKKKLGYDHLCLPMRYEDTIDAAMRRTSIGFTDPREKDGELLWEQRFNEEAVRALEKSMGSYGAAGQLQQRPAPREGGMFKTEAFTTVEQLPSRLRFIAYWDKAATDGAGAYTAGVLMAEYKVPDTELYQYYVVDVVRGQWSSGVRNKIMRETSLRWRRQYSRAIKVFIEREGGSAGKEVVKSDISNLRGLSAAMDIPHGDKVTRAGPWSAALEAGNVFLLEAEWNDDYIAEHTTFPKGFKDQVDASSGAYMRLTIPLEDEKKPVPSEYGYAQGWNVTQVN